MRFKIIDGSMSFVCQIEGDRRIETLYEEVESKIGSKRYLFKGTPKCLVEKSSKLISEVFSDLECIYAEESSKVEGPVETATNTLENKEMVFSILEVPSDNSCLFHALSELLNAKSSGELRKMVANEILKDPKAFSPYIEKEPFEYSTWILQPNIWGGAPEITVISKIYGTKVCVIDKDLRVYGFGEEFRSVVYLSYSGTYYNAVISKDRNGNITRKFPYGDKLAESRAKAAVRSFFSG
ncbi:ubiquitin thioesterase OTU1 [Nematocida minor]|uniref:ubiquitin thioesterase OTU1 n=1 Tax=Nematocida minor TaxID=1912983 RepID=UPI002220C1E3|nr:ubiquitin thioesterase OTU1 [Nematocida minor]KAI5190988.1 ubiquitin thioesterase OTU1 [Nematocida minor]